MKLSLFCLLVLCLVSCGDSQKRKLITQIGNWEQRKIFFPVNPVFTVQGRDTVMFPIKGKYKIVSYADSIGCTDCKMRLLEWSDFISYLDSNFLHQVPVYFFFHPKDVKETLHLLKRDNFRYPICFDLDDTFNKLNQFPLDLQFQTFLLDENNKVAAVGNPIHNSKIKDLYLKVLSGEKDEIIDDSKTLATAIKFNDSPVMFGKFNWLEQQSKSFSIKNIGSNPLIIQNVDTSCGCITVSYSKEPVFNGDSILVNVVYKANRPGHFNKTITVHCNADSTPIVLKITGSALRL